MSRRTWLSWWWPCRWSWWRRPRLPGGVEGPGHLQRVVETEAQWEELAEGRILAMKVWLEWVMARGRSAQEAKGQPWLVERSMARGSNSSPTAGSTVTTASAQQCGARAMAAVTMVEPRAPLCTSVRPRRRAPCPR